MSNTLPIRPDSELGLRIRAFISWWSGELWGMVPGFLQQSAYGDKDTLLVLFQGDAAVFMERRSGKWQELGRALVKSGPIELRSQIPGLARDRRTRIARLPAEEILNRPMELPLAAEPELARILSYQLDTVSPYPPEQIYHAHRITGRDFDQGTLHIELIVAPKESVDPVIAKMQEWHLTPDVVDCEGEQPLSDPEINLLPSGAGKKAGMRHLSRFNIFLLLINLLLLVGLAVIHLTNKAKTEQELGTRVETARLETEAANILQEKVDKLRQQELFLQQRKKQHLPALEVINELTRILPDDTWLESALYTDDEISLSGISSKSSTLISKIERSDMFEEVAFQSSVVQDFRSGGERFQIQARTTVPSREAE